MSTQTPPVSRTLPSICLLWILTSWAWPWEVEPSKDEDTVFMFPPQFTPLAHNYYAQGGSVKVVGSDHLRPCQLVRNPSLLHWSPSNFSSLSSQKQPRTFPPRVSPFQLQRGPSHFLVSKCSQTAQKSLDQDQQVVYKASSNLIKSHHRPMPDTHSLPSTSKG